MRSPKRKGKAQSDRVAELQGIAKASRQKLRESVGPEPDASVDSKFVAAKETIPYTDKTDNLDPRRHDKPAKRLSDGDPKEDLSLAKLFSSADGIFDNALKGRPSQETEAPDRKRGSLRIDSDVFEWLQSKNPNAWSYAAALLKALKELDDIDPS